MDLVNLLTALASNEKGIREEAERLVEAEWITRPAALFPGLISVLNDRNVDRIVSSKQRALVARCRVDKDAWRSSAEEGCWENVHCAWYQD